MKRFQILLFIFIFSFSSSAGCLDKFKQLFRTTSSEAGEDTFDESRRSFLRGGAAAVAVAAAPGGLAKIATASVSDAVNRSALLRKAAKLKNGSSVTDIGDYAGSLDRAATSGDFSGVSEILQRRAQMLAERLQKGSDIFSKMPERVINEGARPSLRSVLNNPNYQNRIARGLRASRISTLSDVNEELYKLREELMSLILENQNLSIQAIAMNNLELSLTIKETDLALFSQWKIVLEETRDKYAEYNELFPQLNRTIDLFEGELEQIIELYANPVEEVATEIVE